MERQYETLYVQHPETATQRVAEINERIQGIVTTLGGRVADFQEWGLRELAYPIRHQKRGLYFLIRYTGSGQVVEELQRNLRILDEVLRYVTVRIPARLLKGQLGVASEGGRTRLEGGRTEPSESGAVSPQSM